MNIRLIDAGVVSGLRSQSIYHGLGYAQQSKTPDTIVLTTPETPYICIGYFQDPENELDINYCRNNHLPIIRRETGGGAVYIDNGQLFVQWIFQQESLPRRVDKRFQLFIEPLVETYKFFGINAYFYPINDVHVAGKKIVGTGAGTIGEAQIVTGNFLFDFNYATMLNAIKVPSEDFREAVAKNLNNFITNMKRELGQLPERDAVIHIYKLKCEEILGLKIELGDFTDSELMMMEKIEKKFVKDSWLYEIKKEPSENKLIKIHLGIWIGDINFDMDIGSINALVTIKDDFITEIKLTLNGLTTPDYSIRELENNLLGVKMDRALIAPKVKAVVGEHLIEEWVECIYKVKELQLRQSGYGTLERSN
jgi:lipoate-protein ligase A